MVDKAAGPLSEHQIDEFKHRLEIRLGELREEVKQELLNYDQEKYSDIAGRVHDAGDESVADLLADVNLAIIDHHINDIRDVERSLNRIRDRTYGVCVSCQEPIVAARLEAYPTANRCHQCQSRREQNQRGSSM